MVCLPLGGDVENVQVKFHSSVSIKSDIPTTVTKNAQRLSLLHVRNIRYVSPMTRLRDNVLIIQKASRRATKPRVVHVARAMLVTAATPVCNDGDEDDDEADDDNILCDDD